MKCKLIKISALLLSIIILTTGCGAKNAINGNNGKYVFHVVNEDKKMVPGVTLQICTDAFCQTIVTDENGTAVFDGEPAEYEVHVKDYPAEYYYDSNEVYVTKSEPESVTFVLKKAGEKTAQVDNQAVTDKQVADKSVNQSSDQSTAANQTASEKEDLSAYAEGFPYLDPICHIEPSNDKVEFMGVDMNGNTVDESVFADYDLTLVNMWDPWCSPCKREMPVFQQAYELAQYAGIKFNVVGLYRAEENAKDVIDQLGITYTIAKTENHVPEFETPYIPVNVFVNKEGYVLPITYDEYLQTTTMETLGRLEGYRNGNYDTQYEEYFQRIDGMEKNGTLGQYLKDKAKEDIYSKGQTNMLSQYELFQFIADRLPVKQ